MNKNKIINIQQKCTQKNIQFICIVYPEEKQEQKEKNINKLFVNLLIRICEVYDE